MSRFINISDANFKAFTSSNRTADIVAKKQEIIDSLTAYHNVIPSTVLFVGYSSFVMANYGSASIYITGIDNKLRDQLAQQNIKFTYIPTENLAQYYKKFQVVVAVDEYFTYADSDQDQKDMVNQICSLASSFVITTLRDYKNQDYKDREFSLPTVLRSGSESLIFLEAHEWSATDRSSWISTVYQINANENTLTTYGKQDRRAMYFKQLAKFSYDAAATHFLVHKNLMYKGLCKKNYEHVITVKFD